MSDGELAGLVLNVFYIACLVMIWMYFFNSRLITTDQFNYWCSISVGITVLLRDIRPTIDFVSELLSKIDGLDVLQPESLRERVRQILEGALSRNP